MSNCIKCGKKVERFFKNNKDGSFVYTCKNCEEDVVDYIIMLRHYNNKEIIKNYTTDWYCNK